MIKTGISRFAGGGLVLAFALAALVAGCSGGGGGSTALPAGSTSSGGTNSMSLSFAIPAPRTESAGAVRSTQSVPSSVKGIAVYAYAATTTIPSTPVLVGDLSLTPTAGNTSLCVAAGDARQCTISFTAPVGSDIVTIKIYDAEPVGGAIPASANLVANGNTPITISANGSNTATISLNSVSSSSLDSTGGIVGGLSPTAGGSILSGGIVFTMPSGVVPGGQSVTVSVSEVIQLLLPLSTQRRPQFVQGAGNTLIDGYGIVLAPALTLTGSLSLMGTQYVLTGGLVSTFTAAQTGTLVVAQYTGTGYTDVGFVTYSFDTSSNTLAVTSDVNGLNGQNGISQSGIYVLYLPPTGSAPTPIPSPTSTPTATPTTAPTATPTPPTVRSIALTFSPTTGGTSYYPSATADPNLNYLVLGAPVAVKVTLTAIDTNGATISGSFASPITLKSNSTGFTFPNPVVSSAPTTLTLQYNGIGRTPSSTVTITVNGVTVTGGTLTAKCLTGSVYEGSKDDTNIDTLEDTNTGCP